jgi:DNA-binding IclR family transcriptional regulator
VTAIEKLRAKVEEVRRRHYSVEPRQSYQMCRCGSDWPCHTLQGWEAALALAVPVAQLLRESLSPNHRLRQALERGLAQAAGEE